MKRHRHQEFIRFLNVIEGRVSKKKTIHVIVDNYATHKHPDVMEWLEKHRRFVFHFTPTSASWLNAIEGFFAKLTKKSLKRGVFRSLRELKDAIHRFLDHTNANPKPFTWTKDPNKIIAAVKRGHQVLDSIHQKSSRRKSDAVRGHRAVSRRRHPRRAGHAAVRRSDAIPTGSNFHRRPERSALTR